MIFLLGGVAIEKVIDKFIKVLDPYDFYSVVRDDLKNAKEEVLIFSPFVKSYLKDSKMLLDIFKELGDRGVKVKIVVKPDIDSRDLYALKNAGAEVYARDTHVKAVIIDNHKVVYVGSLNILSSYGKEDVMIRISGLTGKIIPKILSKKLFEEIKPPRESEVIK